MTDIMESLSILIPASSDPDPETVFELEVASNIAFVTLADASVKLEELTAARRLIFPLASNRSSAAACHKYNSYTLMPTKDPFGFLVGFDEEGAEGTPVEGCGFMFGGVDCATFGFVGSEFEELSGAFGSWLGFSGELACV